jgi:eukaryotic-like serine/threonine-protein kinase
MTPAGTASDEHEGAPSLSELLIGEMVGGTYLVVDFIGRGAIGMVFKGVQLSVGRFVVLKILAPNASVFESDPNFAERFQLEATTCGKLKHPNTVTLHEFGEHELAGQTLYYMVMEYVQGTTLRHALNRAIRFPPDRAIDVTLQIARSLREAHGLGIVHRDLKPSNVMITESEEGERIKVLDFGIAKVVAREQEGGGALTMTGTVLGSPHYMAPEQMQLAPVDGRSDIYALGCILFEMLAGAPPYRGNGFIDTCAAHLTKPFPTLASVAGGPLAIVPELETLVRRCTEKAPEDRFQSVEELTAALKSLRRSTAPGAQARVARRPGGRSPLLGLAAGLLFVAGIPTLLLGIAAILGILFTVTHSSATEPDALELPPLERGTP